MAGRYLAEIIYASRRGADTRRLQLRFEREVIDLFVKLAPKENIKGLPNFQTFRDKIFDKTVLMPKELYDMYYAIGDYLQESGIYKIEFLKSAPAEEAYREEEYVGED
jgi:hypothetical protein